MIAPRIIVILFILVLVSSLVGCAPPRKVAVEERTTITAQEESERLGGSHIRIVQPGDTIYGIAFANGLDAKKLAAWNQVNDTSRLQVGQRLRLDRPPGFVEIKKPRPSSSPATTASRSSAKAPSAASSKAAQAKQGATEQSAVVSTTNSNASRSWRWPTSGKVSAGFKPRQGQQGIDISGRQGQAVKAAQPGEVVYVGNSLKGYGNLVILKHAGDYLSAYAHNLETFVREGQTLRAGERLASMGLVRGKAALHFQIRKAGEPVDPLKFLPKN